MDEDDVELVRRGNTGDVAAFMQLCGRYERLVFSIAYRILHDVDEASEAVQIAIENAFHGLGAMREEFRPWFCRIVKNTAITLFRKRKPNALSLDDDEAAIPPLADPRPDPARHASEEEMRQRVHSVLARLTPEHTEVLSLYYLVDTPYDAIAKTLGLSIGTVSSRVNRAKESFLKLWTIHS